MQLFFCSAYILSLPFLNVLNLPVTGKKLQPPEIVFCFLAILSLSDLWRKRQKLIDGILDWSILFWLLALVTSAISSSQKHSWLEILGTFYLCCLYFIFKVIINKENLEFLKNSYLWSASIASTFGIAGWTLTRFGIHTILAWPTTQPYPYIGLFGRAKAFTTNPNMLASVLGVALLILI